MKPETKLCGISKKIITGLSGSTPGFTKLIFLTAAFNQCAAIVKQEEEEDQDASDNYTGKNGQKLTFTSGFGFAESVLITVISFSST